MKYHLYLTIIVMVTNCKAFVSNLKKQKINILIRNQELDTNTMDRINSIRRNRTNNEDNSIPRNIYNTIDYSDFLSKYSINKKEFLDILYKTFKIIIIGTLIMTPSVLYYKELLKYISENSQTGSTAMINSKFF